MWTYDASDLGTTTASGRLNSVRLLVGDTDTNDQQLANEEINFALDQTGDNVYFAAAWAARAIAGKYSRLVTSELDGALLTNYSDLQGHYSKLAERMEYQGKKTSAVVGVLAGGITISGVEAVRSNTDRIESPFRRDRFRNPPGYSTPEYE